MAGKQIAEGEGEWHMRYGQPQQRQPQTNLTPQQQRLQQITNMLKGIALPSLQQMQPPPQNSPARTLLEGLRTVVKDILKELDRLLGTSLAPEQNEFKKQH